MSAVDAAARDRRLAGLWPRSRPAIMAVVNCTPDSFSDGGRHLEPDEALTHAERLLDEGADLVDVGGESTRPGAEPVPAAEEARRVLPVIRALRRRRPDAVISVDTRRSEVAAAALSAGADVVNDVTAGRDPELLPLAAGHGAAVVLMHMRGEPRTMQQDPSWEHPVAEVHAFLRDRAAAAAAAGFPPDRVWLDPGIGFGKDDAANLALLAALPELEACGHPVVVGPSRKSFIGRLTGAAVGERLPGTLAALIPTLGLGRAVVRVHEAAPVRQFLDLAVLLREAAG
jgi:dihydropteroate synthase